MAKKSKYDEILAEEEVPAEPSADGEPVGPHHLGGAYVGHDPVPVGGNTPGVHPPSIVGTSHAVPIEGPKDEAPDGDDS